MCNTLCTGACCRICSKTGLGIDIDKLHKSGVVVNCNATRICIQKTRVKPLFFVGMQGDLCFLSFFFHKFGYEPACNDLWTTHQFKRVELCGKVFFIGQTLKSGLLQCPDVVI